MKIIVIVIGKLKERYFRDAEAEYLKRLRPYCKLEVIEARDEKAALAAIPERATVYAFDERGEQPSSAEFAANVLANHQSHGGGAALVFLIGGADGHSAAARKRASKLIAFGRLTIAHRLVRLLVLEQIYRGFRIVRGEPYHRD